MLNTIIEIGKQMSGGDRHPWEDFLQDIRVKNRDKDKKKIILRLVFDLDAGKISYDDGLEEYSVSKRDVYGLIGIIPPKSKGIYVAAPLDNLDRLVRSVFGRFEQIEEKNVFSNSAEFNDAVLQKAPDLHGSEFSVALNSIKKYGDAFLKEFFGEKNEFTIKNIPISSGEVIVAVYLAVSSQEKNWVRKPIAQMQGYKEFIERYFLTSSDTPSTNQKGKLCYATGENKHDIVELDFLTRYNLNKIFQATTTNYIANFEKNNAKKNYQVSEITKQYLDRGSTKILNDFEVNIGGVRHVCIPRLPIGATTYAINDFLRLKDQADLIFRIDRDLRNLLGELKFQAESNPYWVDFFGIESDLKKTYLKIGSHIRDVNGIHIQNLIKEFRHVSLSFSKLLNKRNLNLGRFFYFIPVRKEFNTNNAFDICKRVLEQQPIKSQLLYQHFDELVLCIRFNRYKAYQNIKDPKFRDDLKKIKSDPVKLQNYLLKEAVFSYLAFLQILKNLNLLDMEPKNETQAKDAAAHIQAETLQFLDDMGYTSHQRAMFFLGKALRQVVNVQRRDDKSKTALDMVNFNGLDVRSILNLASGIMEKGRQYRAKHSLDAKVEYNLNRFYQFFPGGENAWKMDSKEALFYLLSGYTHFVPKDQPEDEEELIENDSEN